MLTMSRLPSDSFLASGAMDLDRSMPSFSRQNGASASVISPLSLSHAPHQHSYFDNKFAPPNYIHSPSPSGIPGSRQYLSPDQTHQHPNGSAITSPFMAPTIPTGSMSPFGHLSPTTAAALLQRREEHNRRALESWQAERVHLEASRARAEEMFREERTLMDDERMIWIDQKQKLEMEVAMLKKRAEKAESDNALFMGVLTKVRQSTGDLSASNQTLREGINSAYGFLHGLDGTWDKELKNMRSSSGGGSADSGPQTSRFRSPLDGVSPNSAPGRGSTMPESKPFEPLDPRMQSGSPPATSPGQTQPPIPSIDVHEINPELEGIRLKAPAIQNPTFTDEKPSSPSTPADQTAALSPGDVTKKTLQAPEQTRLTMHAGHTPNHSMSFSQLPTMDSTLAPNTAGSSGTSTPIYLQDQGKTGAQNQTEQKPVAESSTAAHTEQDANIGDEAVYEPSDEVPALKGPLCLKNRPAADAVFLRRLSDKLEEVKANDVRPSVLSEPETKDSTEESTGPEPSAATGKESNQEDQESGMENIEADIPLKLKKSSNFGQPLGELNKGGSF